MAQKTFPVFDHPSYTTRQSVQFAKLTGAAGTAKFITLANSYLYSLTTFIDTLGTSTFSSTLSGNTIQLTVIVNTNTTGTAVGLSTSTFGPYAIGGPSLSTSTGTAVVGGTNVFVLNTAAGVGGFGGYYVPGGSEVVALIGSDATSVVYAAVDFQLAPLAAVTA